VTTRNVSLKNARDVAVKRVYSDDYCCSMQPAFEASHHPFTTTQKQAPIPAQGDPCRFRLPTCAARSSQRQQKCFRDRPAFVPGQALPAR
jgi:hypothetical protein